VACVTRVLAVNTGSSSLKLAVVADDDSVVAEEKIADWDGSTDPLRDFVAAAEVDAVGHRFVHGGPDLHEPVEIDAAVEYKLREAATFAPLHQPRALDALAAVRELCPDLPHVACLDTAFHRHLPEAAAHYALPWEWTERWHLRRYGFHGLSHEYAATRTAEILGRDVSELRTVVCHLGSGASLCAVDRGRSVDTTMGLTPTEGLVMGTRPGNVDPGLLLWLLTEQGITPAELDEAVTRRSGLLGLSGLSADLEDVVEAAHDGDARSERAVNVYLHRLTTLVGAMAAAMKGLDAVCFTGGVGENSSLVRQATADALAWAGMEVDRSWNAETTTDRDISVSGAGVRTVVVTAREDLAIAQHTRQALQLR
jgi:acetate kinase